MSSFSVKTGCFVSGIKIQAVGPSKDNSWTIHVSRANFVAEEKLGETIAVIVLVPAGIYDPEKSQIGRRFIPVPEECLKVSIFVGIGVMNTDQSREFLGIEIRGSNDATETNLTERFQIGEL